jgi:putative ABC transport system permease protein
MQIIFTIALRNLIGARRRTALLSMAVGTVTMMLVLMFSLSAGIEDNLVSAATTLATGHVNVAGFYKSTPGEAIPVVTKLSEVKKIVEENTPGIDYVIDRQRGWGKVISDTGSIQAGLNGIDAKQESRFFEKLRLAPLSDYVEGGGSELEGDTRKLSEPHSVVLFASQAKRIGVRVGDSITVQTETFGGRTNTVDATVVAVAKDQGLLSNWTVFIPRADAVELYQFDEDTSGALWIYLKDIDQAEAVMVQLREVLAAKGYGIMEHEEKPFYMKFETVQGEDWTGQRLDLTIWKDEVSFLTYILKGFNLLTSGLIAILVALIVVGISNTMWNVVRERTKEIGTMRAIGMGSGRVLVLILLEAVLLGLVATTGGAILGALVAAGVNAIGIEVSNVAFQSILLADRVRLSVHASSLIGSIGALSLVTGLAAIWPAIRGASVPPVTAIQTVE